MVLAPEWLGSLLFGYRHIQSAGSTVNDSDTLNFSSAFTAAYNPVTKVVDVGFTGGTVSSFLKATGSGGSEGADLGRFDAYPSTGAIPGAVGIKNFNGTGYSLKVDNAGALISLNLNTTVTGTTTLDGDAEVTGGLTVDNGMAVSNGTTLAGGATINGGAILGSSAYIQAASNTVLSSPTGTSTIWFDSGSSLWKFLNHGGSATAFATATDLTGYVPTTRTVSTTSPLSGGGALSGNLTLTLGTVTTANGGNGLTSWTAGDLGYYASGTALNKLAIGAANAILVSNGSAPTYTLTPTGLTSLSTAALTVNGRNVVGPSKRLMTSSGTALDGEIITADATSAGFTITVPIGAATHVSIKRSISDTSGHAITISPASGTIEGSATIALSTVAGTSIDIWGDGTNAEVR